MGFGQRWIRRIKQCISTTTFFVLIKDTLSNFFQSSRGLRQGDLLFPYLFILAMEALSQLLTRAKNGGYIVGFKVERVGRDWKYLISCLSTIL